MTSSRGAQVALGVAGVCALAAGFARDVLKRYALPLTLIALLGFVIVALRLGEMLGPTIDSVLGAVPAGGSAISRLELDAQKLVDEGQAFLKTGQRVAARARFEQAVELDLQNENAVAGRQWIDDEWRATSNGTGQSLKVNAEDEEARSLDAGSWDAGGDEPLPVRGHSLLRYLVPVVIIIVSLAILIVELFVR